MLYNIWVTSKCNMQCKYCYEGDHLEYSTMSKETAEKVIEYISCRVRKLRMDEYIIINFHGGEPLIAFDLIEMMISKLRQKLPERYFLFGLTTNGLLLTNRIIDYLCDNFEYSLSISIDGNKEVHDKNRVLPNGEGTHSLIVNNIKKLIEKRKNVRARVTFTSETCKDLYETVLYLYNLGFHVIIPVADYFDSSWSLEGIKIFEEQLILIYDKFKSFSKDNLDIGLMRDNSTRLKNGICDPLNCSINIKYDGSLYPCTYVVGDEFYRIGDIYSGIFPDKLNDIYDLSTIENRTCLGCTNYDYCISTRCKIMNKVLTGDYYTASPVFCNIENIIYKLSEKNNYKVTYLK